VYVVLMYTLYSVFLCVAACCSVSPKTDLIETHTTLENVKVMLKDILCSVVWCVAVCCGELQTKN